jgi:hypothetical protein
MEDNVLTLHNVIDEVAVPVVQPTARPMARVAKPSADKSTIRARCPSRCSVFVERAKPSSSVRSSFVNVMAVAPGMLFMHP